jgi:hypothetical protein
MALALFRALARSQVLISSSTIVGDNERNLRAFLLLECIWQWGIIKTVPLLRTAVGEEKLATVPLLPENGQYRLSRIIEQIARSAHGKAL